MKEENADILKRYFHALQEEAPLVPLEEVKELINNRTSEKKRLPQPFFNNLKFWIMTSLILVLTTTLFLSGFFEQKPLENRPVEEVPQKVMPDTDKPELTQGFPIKGMKMTKEELADKVAEDSLKISNPTKPVVYQKNAGQEVGQEASSEIADDGTPDTMKTKQSSTSVLEKPNGIDISGIPFLELAPKALALLGIEVYNKEIYYANESWPFISAFYPSGSRHDFLSSKNKFLSELSFIDSANLPSLAPVFISDYTGNTVLSSYDPEEVEKELKEDFISFSKEKDNWQEHKDMMNRYYSRKLNSYLGILVRSGADPLHPDSNGYHPDLIFWYEVNEELLNALPKETAEKVRQDYSSLFSPEMFITGKTNATATNQSCTYFESCKNRKGAFQELFVNPNPFTEQTHLTLTSTEERRVTIRIYSIQGKLMATVFKNVLQPVGKKEYLLQLPHSGKGIYLISVTTDHGEILSQRLIKQN
ncbi:MAG: T9SS type A sorting domain-containing protein [Bacteroidia bacterium]